MTKNEALKMAIEALESFEKVYGDTDLLMPHNFYKSLKACKEALEQPAQEPVAWMNDIAFSMDKELLGTRSRIVPLYTHPAPAREPLSEDEIARVIKKTFPVITAVTNVDLKFARAIEQAHGIGE